MPTLTLAVLTLCLSVFGWLIGVVVNLLADTLPYDQPILAPGCLQCEQPIRGWDYLALRPCQACQSQRAVRGWIVQITFAIFANLLWWAPIPLFGPPLSLVIAVYFGIVTVIDLEHRLILHTTSLAGAILALLIGSTARGLVNTAVGGTVGLLAMITLFFLANFSAALLWKKVNQTNEDLSDAGDAEATDEPALGFGDVYLCSILGMLVGWPNIIHELLLTAVLGGIFGLIAFAWLKITRRYQMITAVPYAPFLIAAASIILYIR